MTNTEINKQIAFMLGFKVYPIKVNGRINNYGWRYPEDWQDQVVQTPEQTLPNFVEAFNNLKRIGCMIGGSGILIRDHNSIPNKKDIKE